MTHQIPLKLMSENELRDERDRLRKKLEKGELTISQVNRLAEIEEMLSRFDYITTMRHHIL